MKLRRHLAALAISLAAMAWSTWMVIHSQSWDQSLIELPLPSFTKWLAVQMVLLTYALSPVGAVVFSAFVVADGVSWIRSRLRGHQPSREPAPSSRSQPLDYDRGRVPGDT